MFTVKHCETSAMHRAELAIEAANSRLVEQQISRSIRFYSRPRNLPRLIRVEPADLFDESPAATIRVIDRLRRALNAARNAVRADHWTGSPPRCLALRQALAAEEAHLDKVLTWGQRK